MQNLFTRFHPYIKRGCRSLENFHQHQSIRHLHSCTTKSSNTSLLHQNFLSFQLHVLPLQINQHGRRKLYHRLWHRHSSRRCRLRDCHSPDAGEAQQPLHEAALEGAQGCCLRAPPKRQRGLRQLLRPGRHQALSDMLQTTHCRSKMSMDEAENPIQWGNLEKVSGKKVGRARNDRYRRT